MNKSEETIYYNELFILQFSTFKETCGLFKFYGISNISGYLMANPFYTYILNIYDLVWLDFMAYQPL